MSPETQKVDGLTRAQESEMLRLKSHFPYRIIFGVVYADGRFEAQARKTKATMNRLLREGHTVYTLASVGGAA